MPGLVGYIYNEKNAPNSTLINDMCNIIKHREWYCIDDYTDLKRGVAVSRVHLGIINNEPQPYSSENGKVKIFLYGEIYDDSAADCNQLEYIHQIYEKEGVDFASKLNGSFVIIVIDEAKERVIIANDIVASKPFFYFIDETGTFP